MGRCLSAVILLFSSLLISGIAAVKPKIHIADDGFPTQQNTPEGAASDLARSFIKHDPTWFRDLCIRPYGAGQSRIDYIQYLSGVAEHMAQEKEFPAQDSPQKIVQVYAARHLTKNGPASYAYAAFDFQDVMFVDVKVKLINGQTLLRRTMVIKDKDEKWYALPVPDISPLMSDGIYDEAPSSQPFTVAYDLLQK
jgi:hypothetical protein